MEFSSGVSCWESSKFSSDVASLLSAMKTNDENLKEAIESREKNLRISDEKSENSLLDITV